MTKTYRVSGMSCEGCVRSVTNAIKQRLPEASITVDLDRGTVQVDGADDEQGVREAVDDAGFEYGGSVA